MKKTLNKSKKDCMNNLNQDNLNQSSLSKAIVRIS